MLSNDILDAIFQTARAKGATFTEVFIERSSGQKIRLLDSKVHEVGGGVEFGIGVRLLRDADVSYGYTNSPAKKDLIALTESLGGLLDAKPFNHPHTLQSLPAPKTGAKEDSSQNLRRAAEFLQIVNQTARKHHSNIVQVDANLSLRRREIWIFNDEGLSKYEQLPYTRTMLQAVAARPGEQEIGSISPGATMGVDFLATLKPEDLGVEIARQAVTKLGATLCPGGVMPVLLGNGFGGVIFHEACGHLLETTSVQKKASVFHDKMGQQIAHEAVNAYDDATVPSAWGTFGCDDEGHPSQKTKLIEKGILKSFLVDYVGHLKTGHRRTGSGRRQSYHYAPGSRMSNTFIAPGPHSLDDMLASIDHGLYCTHLGGGSVQPGTGEFNFAALECYLVEKGKITKPLKGATLIGSGPEILQKISMVGNDFKLMAGMCGSASGSVPVTVGQPSLKIDSILVGGKNS